MTEDEKAVVLHLAAAWNAFLRLPIEHPDDQTEFRQVIHTAQNQILGRCGRREMNT